MLSSEGHFRLCCLCEVSYIRYCAHEGCWFNLTFSPGVVLVRDPILMVLMSALFPYVGESLEFMVCMYSYGFNIPLVNEFILPFARLGFIGFIYLLMSYRATIKNISK